ncbi:MAG: glycosyltransferase [Tissierellia bacterium]|nr:glycosyltransferase [Tissierellia bacterium]
MPTLLQINVVVNTGSTGHIAEEICQLSIQKGWESYIAYGRNKRPSESNLIKIGTDWDIIKHVIQARLFDRMGFGSKRPTIELIRCIKKLNPDIIHLHNIHGYYINIEILFNYLAIAKIPVVWTLHDCWALTGHCAYFDFVGCNKWVTGCFSCHQKKYYPSRLWIDNSKINYFRKSKLFNSVNNLTIVPVSMWLQNIVNQSYLKKYQSQVINNGVDVNTFFPQINYKVIRNKLGIGNQFMILGVSSIWEPRKGLSDFVKLSKLIDQNSIIVLVGLNKKQIKNLPFNIIGVNRTENINQLAEIYSAADLYLNLTYEDNFPTTNIESLACGTPILTYDTGGSIEAVSSETGFIVDKGDYPSIMNVINIVKEKGKSSYSKACRDRAEKFFNKDDRYMEYIKLYNHLLNVEQKK